MTVGLISNAIYQHGSGHLNIGGVGAGLGFSPFLDFFKSNQVGNMTLTRSAGGSLFGAAIFAAGGYLDSTTGFLAVPCPSDVTGIIYYLWTNSDTVTQAVSSGLVWNISWDGRGGTVAINLLTSGGTQSINNTTGTGTFTFGTNPGNTQIVVTITDRTDPPRNIKVWQQRYNTNWLNGEKFNPDWLAQAKRFYRLRLVDWMGSNVTDSTMSTFTSSTQIASESWFSWGAQNVDGASGPYGLVPLSMCAALANTTGCKLHFNIPYLASDQCVTDIATYMRDHTTAEVGYEYSNEAWNTGYPVWSYCQTQGSTSWPGDGARANKYYGYRAAQIMKIIRDVYNDTTRWSGILATQCVSSIVTSNILIGVAKWKSDNSSALNASDLFKGVYVTGYFGDQENGQTPTAVTNANPGVVTLTSHGYYTGQKIRFFCSTGMTQLNNVDATITVVDANSFSLGIDTTSYGAWAVYTNSPPAYNYCMKAVLFDIMDQSLTNFTSDPVTYPTKYTYFNQQLAASLTNGNCTGGYPTGVSLAYLAATAAPSAVFTASMGVTGVLTVTAVSSGTLTTGLLFNTGAFFFNVLITGQLTGSAGSTGTYQTNMVGFTFVSSTCTRISGPWEAQKAVADANGLALNQYESGLAFVGNFATTNPSATQWTEYLLASGHSSELAAVYTAGYAAFTSMGGTHPSKYAMAGPSSAFGTWGGMQTVPETPTNPVWQAVLTANGG